MELECILLTKSCLNLMPIIICNCWSPSSLLCSLRKLWVWTPPKRTYMFPYCTWKSQGCHSEYASFQNNKGVIQMGYLSLLQLEWGVLLLRGIKPIYGCWHSYGLFFVFARVSIFWLIYFLHPIFVFSSHSVRLWR